MRERVILIFLAAALAACGGGREDAAPQAEGAAATPEIGEEPAYEAGPERAALASPPAELEVSLPEPDARRGRILFVTNGCVICHQVNGVGGRAAPSLDARPGRTTADGRRVVDPLAFSARIWSGAAAMTALQETELGYVIDLEAQDLADLAAFAASPEEQALVTRASVPEPLREWFIDAPYWTGGDWSEYRSRGTRIPDVEPPEED